MAEQAEVQEVVQTWLNSSSNISHPGYSSVAELYILHILLPLGKTTEAIELLEDEVGQAAFTDDQRQTAFAIINNWDAKKEPSPESVSLGTDSRGRIITLQGKCSV